MAERETQSIGNTERTLMMKGSAVVWSDTDRKSTRLNSSHTVISYAVFCLKKKKRIINRSRCFNVRKMVFILCYLMKYILLKLVYIMSLIVMILDSTN